MMSTMEDRIVDEVVDIVMGEIEVQVDDEATAVIEKLKKVLSSLGGQ